MMKAATKKRLAKYWGYILVVVLYVSWFQLRLDPVILAGMSSLVIIYCLFQAPVPCCALTRKSEYADTTPSACYVVATSKRISGKT